MVLRLRDMEPKHLGRVVELDGLIAQRPWSKSMFEEELNLSSFCRVLLNDYGTVAGFCVSRLQLDEWHLLSVGVGLDFRRQGLGERLVADVVRKAALGRSRAVLLEVRASNEPALKLYKKMQFETLYVRENYYKGPPKAEDAVVMDRRVKERDREFIS
jgi:ribosomal-protein-alanine acetyltransferase